MNSKKKMSVLIPLNNTSKDSKKPLSCVICKSKFKIPQEAPKGSYCSFETVCSKCWEEFNRNWDFLELLAVVDEEKIRCCKCQKQKQEIFCVECKEKLCVKCFEENHQSHISAKTKSINNLIEEKAAFLREKVNELERVQDEKNEAIDFLEVKESRMLEEVEKEFLEYQKALEDNKRMLKEEIISYFQKVKEERKSENQWMINTKALLEEINKKEREKKEDHLVRIYELEEDFAESKVNEWKEAEKDKIKELDRVLNNSFLRFDNNLVEFLQKRSLAYLCLEDIVIDSKKEKVEIESSINGSLPELSTSNY